MLHFSGRIDWAEDDDRPLRGAAVDVHLAVHSVSGNSPVATSGDGEACNAKESCPPTAAVMLWLRVDASWRISQYLGRLIGPEPLAGVLL